MTLTPDTRYLRPPQPRSWHHSKQIRSVDYITFRISPLSFTFPLKSREEETIYTSTLRRPSVNNINQSTQLERTFVRAYFNVPLCLFGAFCPREWLKSFTFNTVQLSKPAVSNFRCNFRFYEVKIFLIPLSIALSNPKILDFLFLRKMG